MPPPDLLAIVPEHVADPVRRASWRQRVVTASADAALSLCLNGAVMAGLLGVGFPLRPDQAPQAISVELVDKVPGGDPSSARSDTAPAEQPATSGGEAQKPQTASSAPPVAPKGGDGTEPPRADPNPAAASSRSGSQAAAPPEPATPAASPPSDPAVPPPPEHPDKDPTGRLVEAPSAPTVPLRDAPEAGGAARASPPEAGSSSTATPAQVPVMATPEGVDAVAPPSPPPEVPKPLTEEEQRQARNTATLAAMLPFGSSIGPDPLKARTMAQGQGDSTAYRGQVYANFNKAQAVIADARARHLKGQAVVAFTVDDHGDIASIGIAVSSRDPAVDQAALELIRRAAPFPPPPPGAQRSFSPAIGLGLDD